MLELDQSGGRPTARALGQGGPGETAATRGATMMPHNGSLAADSIQLAVDHDTRSVNGWWARGVWPPEEFAAALGRQYGETGMEMAEIRHESWRMVPCADRGAANCGQSHIIPAARLGRGAFMVTVYWRP